MVKPFGKRVVPMAVIVEGPMDALAAAGEGYYGLRSWATRPTGGTESCYRTLHCSRDRWSRGGTGS